MDVPPSQWVDLDGPVHYVDFGGPPQGPVVVCVHGLGGSHVNWLALAPLLTPTCRVLALDLAGFGHTRGHGRSTSVQANADLVHRFVTEVAGAPVVLVGNSMGGLITMIEAAERPEVVAGLVLVDPAVPPSLRTRPDPLTAAMFAAYFTPGLGKVVVSGRRRTRTAEELARETLRLCCSDPDRVPEPVVRAHIALGQSRSGYAELESEFFAATRSMVWTLARRRQAFAMMRQIQAPVLLLHGTDDRLVSIASARAVARANPTWRFEVARGVGHVPQLEVPRWTAEHVLDWLPAAVPPAVPTAPRSAAPLTPPLLRYPPSAATKGA